MSFPESPEILIRPARAGDSAFVADMFHLSMGKLADHLLENAKQPVSQALQELIVRNTGRFGFSPAFIAERDSLPVGALVACEGARLDWLNFSVLSHVFPALGIIPALDFLRRGFQLPGGREAEKDEYYISNLGVPAAFQGQGVGSRLLTFAEQKAEQAGLKKCALLVGLYNKNALRLYQRHGYQIVETVPHPNEHFGYHRLVKKIS